MTSRQAVVLASRLVCIYLIFWIVVNIVNLPIDILGLHHHWNASVLIPDSSLDRYEFRYDLLRVEAAIVRIALEFFFAGVFFRCGPRMSRFLTADSKTEEPPNPMS